MTPSAQPTPYAIGGTNVPSGSALTVEIPPRVFRGRMTGLLFESNKTFLLPGSLKGIKGLRRFYELHPGVQVLVVGHTDTVGADQNNVTLSMERSRSIEAYLKDDVDVWMSYYGQPTGCSPWGDKEDRAMLAELGYADLQAFQSKNGVSGKTAIRKALVHEYMGIDGTTLPAGTTIKTHGCGPFHLEVPTPPQTDEQRNRRVEIVFFEGRIDPPPVPRCPAGGCSEYEQWKKRTVYSFDLENPFGELEVSVIDPASKTVAAAEVHLAGPTAEDLTCDGQGVARADALIPGTYTVLGRAKGFGDATAQVTVEPAGPGVSPAKAVVQLRDTKGDLGVKVVGDGKPVAGAAIDVKDAAASSAKATAGASGQATFPKLAEGACKVSASAKGFVENSVDATVTGGQSTPVTVQLARANLILRIPYTVAEAAQLPHSFKLSSDDGSVSQTRKLAADCWPGTDDRGFFDFGMVPEDRAYSLQCDDGTTSYALFDKVPFTKLQEMLGTKPGAVKGRPPDESEPPVASPGSAADRAVDVQGAP